MNTVFIVLFLIVAAFFSARYASPYYETAICKRYIKLESKLPPGLFVASSHGRGEKTRDRDRNKMSLVGFLSYCYFVLTITPFIWGTFFQSNDNMRVFWNMIFCINIPAAFLMALINDFKIFIKEDFNQKEYKISIFNLIAVIFCILLTMLVISYIAMILIENGKAVF